MSDIIKDTLREPIRLGGKIVVYLGSGHKIMGECQPLPGAEGRAFIVGGVFVDQDDVVAWGWRNHVE